MASTHMNSMLAITWNLNDKKDGKGDSATSGAKQPKTKRKAQTVDFAPRYNKTSRGELESVVAPVALPPAPTARQQPPVSIAPAATAEAKTAAHVATWWPAPKSTIEPPKAGGEAPKVQWANTMGRSKKSKEVEAKNRVATIEYEQQLLAHRRAQEAAHQEAVAEQQQRIAEHIAHAAGRLVAFITQQQQGKDGAAGATPAAEATSGADDSGAKTAAPEAAASGTEAVLTSPAAPTVPKAAPAEPWNASLGHEYAAQPLEPLLDQTSLDAAFPSMESILKYFADVGAGPLQEIIAGPEPSAVASAAANAAATAMAAATSTPAAAPASIDIPIPTLERPSSPKAQMTLAPWPVRGPNAAAKAESSSSIATSVAPEETLDDDALHAELEQHQADAMMQLDQDEEGDELGPSQLLNLVGLTW